MLNILKFGIMVANKNLDPRKKCSLLWPYILWPYTSSSLLRKATTARCYRSRGPLFPCFFGILLYTDAGSIRGQVLLEGWLNWNKYGIFCYYYNCRISIRGLFNYIIITPLIGVANSGVRPLQ